MTCCNGNCNQGRACEDLPIVTLDGVVTKVIRACLPLVLCLMLGAMMGGFAVWSVLK